MTYDIMIKQEMHSFCMKASASTYLVDTELNFRDKGNRLCRELKS